ncbi:MAG: molybdopterin-guanine dinucleotide biosynthesis protein B [Eggerthellaceae bacterium]|nr:molybdopterin-guanine dinucleotide biosynthesis protein B [Eggerthellaceae bacterium]
MLAESVVPSPAVAVVGRHNSGKTTIVEGAVAELTSRGLDVGTVKHHGHVGFDIDVPGKDSWRHRHAGATETWISAPGQVAMIATIAGEAECAQIVRHMPGHDVVIVEGYRKSGLPTIEVMRAANPHDAQVAETFFQAACDGLPLTCDFVQAARASHREAPKPGAPVDPGKMPTEATVAVMTDIPIAHEAAARYGIPSFDLSDTQGLCDFIVRTIARPRLTAVIQAGGESRRMGRSKATVPFMGRPLIQRLVERVSHAADELVVTTNEPENLGFLREAYPQMHIRLVRDELDRRGALPGIYTALKNATYDAVAVVACDMVFASPRLIAAEFQELWHTGAAAVVPANRNGYEPFHAVYRASACLPAVEARLREGDQRAQAFFDDVEVCAFPQSRVLMAEPGGRCFINANTPEDLAYTEKLARDEGDELIL